MRTAFTEFALISQRCPFGWWFWNDFGKWITWTR